MNHNHPNACAKCEKVYMKAVDELVDMRNAIRDIAIEKCKTTGTDPFVVRNHRPLWYYELPKGVRRHFTFCEAAYV